VQQARTPAACGGGRLLARSAQVGGITAGLIAAAYGLAAATDTAGWTSAWPAHELHGALALALALAGCAGAATWSRQLRVVLRAAATLALLLVAVTQLFDAAHDRALATGPRIGAPGGAALSLALVVIAATLWPLRAPARDAWTIAAQLSTALLWALCAAALCALLPARLLLDWLPLDSGWSWPTTLVLSLLAAAATERIYRQPAVRAYFRAREDRQIFASYLAMLFGVIGLAAMLIGGLLTAKVVDSAKPVLHRSASSQALALGELVARVGAAADHAAADLAPVGAAAASAPALAAWLRDLRRQLDPFGQVGIRLQGAAGAALTEGTFHDGTWTQLPLDGAPGTSVMAPNGLVLEVERAPPQWPGGRLTIHVRPFQNEAQLPPAALLGVNADTMLCGNAGPLGARCLSQARPGGLRMPLPPRGGGEAWPIQRAWRGDDGVLLLRDPALAAAAVAYAPVGLTGLGIVQKLPLAPLVERLTAGLPLVLLTLLAVAGVGAGLLYRRAFPRLRTLRYAKAQMQATLENLPRGVLTLDAQGRISSSNAGAHRLSGHDGGRLEGQPVETLIGCAAGQPPWRPVPGTADATLLAASGEKIPVEILVERFDFEGAPRTVVIIRDLRRELAQRAELARWERIFFHADWGVAASSDDGLRLELINPAFARMHGYQVDELKQRPVLDVFAPEARAELPRHIAEVHARGHHRFESWHQRRDGSVFPVLIDATVVHDPGGRQFRVVNVQDMSEHRRAQDALQRNEALLQLVLRSLPVGVWIADREGRVVATNPAVERLWGGPVALHDGRPVGHTARRLATGQPVAPDDYPMLRAIRTGQASIGELIEIENADGTRRTLMNAAVPLVGGDGVIQGAIAVNEDLTTLVRAEAAIFAAKNFFESLFQSAALGMAVWDAEGRFERVNQALCELLCRDEAALLASTLADVAEPGTAAADLATLARMRTGELGKIEIERRWRRCDGRLIWVLVVVSLVRLPDAAQPQFIVQVLDIDGSRRFQQALQASEARLLNAHRIARLADWEWDPARDEVLLSEQGRRMLGLPPGHAGVLVGTQWLARVHADDRGAVFAALSAALQGRQPLAIDYRLLLEGGGERFLHQQGERSSDEPPRLVGVLQDITERKRVENELLLSRQQLRALSANEQVLIEEERRHIAREVHDELGQALTAMKMELSLLGRRFGGDAALAAQAARISTMIDGTLDVVRHVASNLRPSALDFGLVAAIEWLAEDFGLRWEMPCEVHLAGREVSLSDAHSTALFRIAQESLTNVARHARARRVDIDIDSDGTTLRLTVRDDGVGFDPVAAQERGGSFGLLGMRERALKIGARLRLDSRAGGGTTVDVELPLEDLQEP
jgi:PAS domain S-box-containing protein